MYQDKILNYNKLNKLKDNEFNDFIDLHKEELIFYLREAMIINNNILTSKLYNYIENNKINLTFNKWLAKPDKTIFEHTQDLLRNVDILIKYNYITDLHKIYLLKLACFYHDLGKCNKEFQKRIKNKTKFNKEKEIYHNLLSGYMINEDDFENKNDYFIILASILNHHNYEKTLYDIEEDEDEEILKELIKSLLKDIIFYDFDEYTKIKKTYANEEYQIIKGFLHKCDYAASSENIIEYPNNFLNQSIDNLLKKWQIKNSTAKWNKMQKYCKDNSNENIIVIAQTGMGKTEGSLNWIGNNKAFYFLPLRSAINAMFCRIKSDILEDNDYENKISILHSDIMSIYNDNTSEETDIIKYYNESRQYSLPLTISTIDQLFDFVYKYPCYELKLSTLCSSKIVIDEIQMYDPELLAHIIKGLEILNNFGVKISIITATLSPFINDLLNKNIKFKQQEFTNDLKRHSIKVIEDELKSDNIYNFYIKDNKPKKILVICNTVKKAQSIYKELTKEKKLNNVKMLHSQFTKIDRNILEGEIIKDGKTENKEDIIWISTQIVEASLDIDFDYLFTELSDLMGLLQRLGRCNRKGYKDIDNYNCFIYTQIQHNLLNKIVDEDIYELSKKAILEIDGIFSEKDKMNLINKYFTTENIKKSKYFSKYNKKYEELSHLSIYETEKKDIDMRGINNITAIPIEIYEKNEKYFKELVNKYKESDNKIDKLNILNKIMENTISIRKTKDTIKMKIDELKITKYLSIDIINCNYTENFGYSRKEKDDDFL